VAILIGNVPWRERADELEILSNHLGIPREEIHSVRMLKKSLDARHKKQNWRAVYRLEVADEPAVLAKNPSARVWTLRDSGRYALDDGAPCRRSDWPKDIKPIVVGAGPAGLFAALYMAEAGLPVCLLERGQPVESRVSAVNGFWRGKNSLDTENNLLFGEGGAGTFSDGKIYTRRRDGELGFIFRRLVDFGADQAVLSEAFAHLGTDKVRALLPVFRARLLALGVDLRFGARVDDLIVQKGRCVGVRIQTGEELLGGPVLVAHGHSARDTTAMLVRKGVEASLRPIAIGARIEHPQGLIDVASYGGVRGDRLPPATYRLSSPLGAGRSAHTFCMCPGGMVVPASNDPDRVVVNGMSFAARRAYWGNSAVIVAVQVEDYGASDPLAGYRWQDTIEREAYRLGGSNYRAPAQRVQDFLNDQASVDLPRTSFPMGVVPAELRALLPRVIVDGMKRAIRDFDSKLPGFAGPEGVLIAPETRTTSPIRFIRAPSGESVSLPGFYPVGEGAGYGGGIVSSALDGLRIARGIVGG
jgi:uncharacterized FAD-dependent dehydrogenase